MKVKIRGKNVEVTEAIQEKVTEKLSVLDKYFLISDDVEAKVLVRTYPRGQKIEVTIPTDHITLRAEEIHDDLYAAIDLIVDKLERQIRKQKTRLSRRGNNKLGIDLASVMDVTDSEDVLVRTKTVYARPIDLDEAIMSMEMLGHSFFIYRDLESEAVSVVYKRLDGGYGLLEVESE